MPRLSFRRLSALRLVGLTVVAGSVLVLAGAYALMASYVYLVPSLPTVNDMRAGSLAVVPLRVYARGGELIGEIGDKRMLPVAYEDIPPLVREAFLAAEDAHFFEHSGFDYLGALRAAWVDLISGGFSQGASTITMQAARNMFLNFDKTIRRKLQEVFLTYRMEHEFTKQEILDTYLNVIFLGQRSYGVAAAAHTYFGKSLDQLTLAEAATLAGIPQAPSRYNPIYYPRAIMARRRYVLGQMLRLGDIDAASARAAAAEPIRARDHGGFSDVEAPYVAEMARAALVARFGPDAVNAGYRVYTTIDGRLQAAANRAVRLGLIEYDRRQHGYRGPLRHVTLAAQPSPTHLDALLASEPTVGDLRPAIVTAVAARSATVYVPGLGPARIGWAGLSWARRQLPNGRGVGPVPQRAADVLARGDVVYVVANADGQAQLAQVPHAQAALVALDPNDGAVAALVGGFDFYQSKFNRVTEAHRQPGSGFKPFLYSCALDHGYTPATIVLDAPIVYDDSNGQERMWRPKNDLGSFAGPTRLREGLVFSRNLMTIRMLRDLGIDTATQCAARFGFDPAQMPKDLTLALGSLPVTPLQLVSAYAIFANGGYRVDPYFIDRIDNAAGQVVYQAAPREVCSNCAVPPAAPKPAAAALTASNANGAPAATPQGAETSPGSASTPGSPPGSALPTAATAPAAAGPRAMPVALASAGLGSTSGPSAAAPVPAAAQSAASTQSSASAQAPAQIGPVDPNRAPAVLAPALLPSNRIAPRVISPQNCWLMDDMMADVIRRGTGIRAWLALKRYDIAGKTGTSNGPVDTWFNGFNRNIVASVWVGYDDEQPLGDGAEGAHTALPIWVNFMRVALRAQPDVPRPMPPGLVTARIDSRTGLLVGSSDPDSMYETFVAGHLPPAEQPGTPAPGSVPAGGGQPLF